MFNIRPSEGQNEVGDTDSVKSTFKPNIINKMRNKMKNVVSVNYSSSCDLDRLERFIRLAEEINSSTKVMSLF